MLRAISLALACLVGMNAIAQDTSTKPTTATLLPTPTPVQAGGRITGTVLCSDTGKPARGVGVNLFRAATPGKHDGARSFAVTDTEGRYLFDHVKPGEYTIRARANGYLYLPPPDTAKTSNPNVASEETSFAIDRVTIHSSETATFDITLQRSASLSGHVFYDDGSPAMGAAIRVEQIDPGHFYKPEPGAPSYMPIMRAGDRGNTDERGYFRITTLGTGTYRIAASPALQPRAYELDILLNPEEQGEAQHPANLTVFSGDTIHRTKAKIYKLHPGDEVSDIRITIPLAGMYKLGGDGRCQRWSHAQRGHGDAG